MPWTRNLLVRLVAPYLLAIGAVAISLYGYSEAVLGQLYVDTLASDTLRQIPLLAAEIPWDERGEGLDRRCASLALLVGARVTVLDPDGAVLGDSVTGAGRLASQGEYSEVIAARALGSGIEVRPDEGSRQNLLHVAWREHQGERQRILRIALPMAAAEEARARIRAAVWTGLGVAALLALIPSLWLARRLSRRMGRLAAFSTAVAAGEVPPILTREAEDDIGRLESNLGTMARSLQTRLLAAREEKEKLEVTLSGMVEGVLVVDREGTIQLSNRRAERLFRTPSLVGRALIDITRDPDLLGLLRESRSEGLAPLVREIVLGSTPPQTLRVSVAALPAPPGQPPASILVFHDITEIKKLEAMRRDFVANVSHELRTPLTAIRGYAETLLSGAMEDPELARRFLGVIERHSERLTLLTDDLLALSDLELGRSALRKTPVQLGPLVDAVMETLRGKAEQGGVALVQEVARELPSFLADGDRVEQVLLNLLDNAVKYTPAGGRVVAGASWLSSLPAAVEAPRAAAAAWVEIHVTDTGIGVPRADLPRLTERFYRVDKARSRELGGTGLGLAIVKHIVQAHNGALHIDSEPGRGTRVSVYFPVYAPDAA